jgi:hypothetical protein
MTAARSYVSILFAVIMGAGYAAAAPACVIQATDCNQCGEEGVCHSYLENGVCYCEPGYDWSSSSSESFDCDRIPSKPDMNACNNPHNVLVDTQCFCECGWTWCSDDPADLSCCEGDNLGCAESETDVLSTGDGSDSSSGSGSTGGSSGSTGSETGMESGSGSGSGSGSESGSGEGSGSGSGSGEGSGSSGGG